MCGSCYSDGVDRCDIRHDQHDLKVLHATKCTTRARVFASRLLDMSVARFQSVVSLSMEARADLAWFGAFLHTFNGISLIKPEVAQRVIHVDSCLEGGGGICDGLGYYKISYPESKNKVQVQYKCTGVSEHTHCDQTMDERVVGTNSPHICG